MEVQNDEENFPSYTIAKRQSEALSSGSLTPEPVHLINAWYTAFHQAEFCTSFQAVWTSIFHWHYTCNAGKTASFLGLSHPCPPTTHYHHIHK